MVVPGDDDRLRAGIGRREGGELAADAAFRLGAELAPGGGDLALPLFAESYVFVGFEGHDGGGLRPPSFHLKTAAEVWIRTIPRRGTGKCARGVDVVARADRRDGDKRWLILYSPKGASTIKSP